jgi:hypothetical protein
MSAPVETTQREQWDVVVSACAAKFNAASRTEFRRKHVRLDADLGTVRLAFDKRGVPTVRTGRLLNASSDGVMIRLQEHLEHGATVLMQMTLADQPVVLVGRVNHCTETVGAFKIGIELQFTSAGD